MVSIAQHKNLWSETSFCFTKKFTVIDINFIFHLNTDCYDRIEKTLGDVGVVVNTAGVGHKDYKKCVDINLVTICTVAFIFFTN